MFSLIALSVSTFGSTLRNAIVSRLRDEGGQDLIEYVLITGFIALAAAAAFLVAPIEFDTFAEAVAACVSFDTANCAP